ncbi:MAG: Cys-Gln thioester bond-forming surface protein [Pseudomonadota bacterium]
MRTTKLSTATALLALVLLLGFGSAAQASNINSITVTGWNLTSGLNVTLKDASNNVIVSGGETGAEFFVHIALGNNNFQDVIGYCIDITQGISQGTYSNNYNLYSASTTPTWSSAQQAAAWLLGHYDPSLGNPYSGNLTTTVSALQAAIWEVTYDYSATGNYNLGAGRLTFNNLDSTVAALANSYLTALGAAQTGGTVGLNNLGFAGALVSGANQDLIVGNAGSVATPEPGSMLLFGSAAGLLGWLRRRRGQVSKGAGQETSQEA